MASAMRVFRKFRASDGRIKVATLSGVSALVAVIALLVGVLPVMAGEPGATDSGIDPVQVDWGGGSGACDDSLISLEDGTARGPSSARYEAHINNPRPGENFVTGNDPDQTQFTIDVDANTTFFEFSLVDSESEMVAYDVVANGGKKSNHYAYASDPTLDPEVDPSGDSHLSAPIKDNKEGEVHKLSHVTICYDVPPVNFVCGGEAVHAVKFGELGLFTDATAQVFTVDGETECSKLGRFFIADGETTLDFGTGDGVVMGRADFFKEFESPDLFGDLQYDGRTGAFEVVPWCTIDEAGEPSEFVDVLTSGYPEIPDDPEGHTACKVFEGEDAAGAQHTVVLFEFEDPNFK